MNRSLIFCKSLFATLLITNASSFVIPQQQHHHHHYHHRVVSAKQLSLEAKKSKSKGGKGFGKVSEKTDNNKPVASSSSVEIPSTPPPSPDGGGNGSFLKSVSGGSDTVPTVDESIPVEQRTSQILRDTYGLRTREEQQEAYKREEAAREQRKKLDEWKKLADKGEDFDLMASLPEPVLIGIDRFLKAGVAICTVLFVLAGIGITVEAWSKTTGSALPDDIDNFIVNIIEPNFTPGLGVLLGFSISLGAFAAAQLSSSSSTYREDN